MNNFKILIGCEESQAVTIAFRELGFEAYSCDILPCSGGHPEWHIKEDILNVIGTIKFYTSDRRPHYINNWDLIILHCPCTFTAISGNRYYWNSPLRIEGINFTKKVYEFALSVCKHVVLEQPKTIMQRYIGKKSQVIQPYQFGHLETKETWLWINGLPNLKETNNVYDEMMKLEYKDRAKVHYCSPCPERGKIRSKTYSGIAAAIASQWGNYLI